VRNGKQRGLVGDVADTIRQAFGRIPLCQAPLAIMPPDIATHAPPVATVARVDDLVMSCSPCREELPHCACVTDPVSPNTGVASVPLPTDIPTAVVDGLAELAEPRSESVPVGAEACGAEAVPMRMDAPATRTHTARIAMPSRRRVTLPELSTRPMHDAARFRAPRRREGMELIARTPTRRQVTSPGQMDRHGALRALRALVVESRLAPRDIQLIGVFEPVPDLLPSRLEVDAARGVLLLWYPLRVSAKGVLALAVGRHLADGRLIVARLPR